MGGRGGKANSQLFFCARGVSAAGRIATATNANQADSPVPKQIRVAIRGRADGRASMRARAGGRAAGGRAACAAPFSKGTREIPFADPHQNLPIFSAVYCSTKSRYLVV